MAVGLRCVAGVANYLGGCLHDSWIEECTNEVVQHVDIPPLTIAGLFAARI